MTVQNIARKIATKSISLVKGVTKSVRKNAKIKKRIRVSIKRYKRRKRLEKKRRDQLAALQQSKEQQKGKVPEKDTSPSPMQRLINAITALLIGFVMNKLPEIIEFVKKIIDFVKGLIDGFKGFFDGVKEFFGGIREVFENAKNLLKSLTLENIQENITKFMDKLKNAFGGIKDKLLGGVKNFLGLKNKDPKQEDLNTDLDDDNKNETISKSPVGEIRDNLSEKNGEFDKTLETIKKEATGIGIIGEQNSGLTSDVDDKKYINLTLTGVDTNYTVDELESKVDSTKSKIEKMEEGGANERKIEFEKNKLGMYETALDRKKMQVNLESTKEKPEQNLINNNPINSSVNVSKMNLSKFEPKRESANTIVVANNGGTSSENKASASGGAVLTGFTAVRSDSVQDSLNLALSE